VALRAVLNSEFRRPRGVRLPAPDSAPAHEPQDLHAGDLRPCRRRRRSSFPQWRQWSRAKGHRGRCRDASCDAKQGRTVVSWCSAEAGTEMLLLLAAVLGRAEFPHNLSACEFEPTFHDPISRKQERRRDVLSVQSCAHRRRCIAFLAPSINLKRALVMTPRNSSYCLSPSSGVSTSRRFE
jgi:hypothetical protein